MEYPPELLFYLLKGSFKSNSSIIYLIHCKNFCEYHKVPPPSTTINEKKNKIKQKKSRSWSESEKSLKFLMTGSYRKSNDRLGQIFAQHSISLSVKCR
jgi:hypothetical protein